MHAGPPSPSALVLPLHSQLAVRVAMAGGVRVTAHVDTVVMIGVVLVDVVLAAAVDTAAKEPGGLLAHAAKL